jgi:hypothetical protein
MLIRLRFSSYALRRHRSVISLSPAAFVLVSHVDRDPPSENTSRKPLDPSAFAERRTLFVTPPCGKASERLCSAHSKVPFSGFGYPLNGISSPNLGSLFQLPTLMGFTLQSFRFLSDDRASVSENSFRSRASLHNLRGLASAPQRLDPIGKAVPLTCYPEG